MAICSTVDAEFLIQTLLRLPRHQLYDPATTIDGRTAARFLRLCRHCAQGTPPQYLVKSAPFLDLDILVDRRVLIPRPETEDLVLRAVDQCPTPRFALDFGTGSGCIAIAVACRCPDVLITAVDRSIAALNVARLNIDRYNLKRRIRTLCASRLDTPMLTKRRRLFDLVLSNPPYVPSERIRRIHRRVRDHEPWLALDGGPKGTSIVAMLLEHGPRLLRSGGLLAFEIDATHAEFVQHTAPAARIEHDFVGQPRYVFLTRE